jgi:hypothetical protein
MIKVTDITKNLCKMAEGSVNSDLKFLFNICGTGVVIFMLENIR